MKNIFVWIKNSVKYCLLCCKKDEIISAIEEKICNSEAEIQRILDYYQPELN